MNKTHVHTLALLLLVAAGSASSVVAASRKVKPGDPTPEFTVQDLSGTSYAYTHQNDKALLVIFLSARQANSFKAQADLVRILGEFHESAKALDVVIALDDPNGFAPLTGLKPQFPGGLTITLDQDHHLWGHFGAIAMPTVVITNRQGLVVGSEAGYGYNFSSMVRSYLNQALGVETTVTQASLTQVATVSNGSQAAKLSRLLKAADMMAGLGHFDAAIVEVKKAIELDPNAIEVQVALAEMYCKASKGEEALDTLRHVKGRNPAQSAKIFIISGRAYRLTGHLDQALDALGHATELAPSNPRAYYELGRIYELQGRKDEALKAYRQALTLLL